MDDLEVEEGDLVQWGEAVFGKYGLISSPPEGVVRHVFKNGSIIAERNGRKVRLKLDEYWLLRKAF